MELRFPPNLRAGTSSWSSRDWCGSFYPRRTAPARMIASYAEKLRTVEIDATWHAMSSRRTVEAWRDRTPPGFVFAAKVPKTISHEKYLVDYVYFNNHYAGYAPGSLELVHRLFWADARAAVSG